MRHTEKKRLLVLVLAALAAGGAFGQSWYNSYAPGIDNRTFFNAGVGLGSTRGYTMGIPPVQASLDFKLNTNLPITLGATGMFSTWNYYASRVDVTYMNIGVGGRAMYHFNFARNLDTYWGLTLGWVIQSVDVAYGSGSYDGASFLNAYPQVISPGAVKEFR